jgi:hypothetical protein
MGDLLESAARGSAERSDAFGIFDSWGGFQA